MLKQDSLDFLLFIETRCPFSELERFFRDSLPPYYSMSIIYQL
jgi:hypothetical protein